jgi:ketosteroid isomerase-like protein
MRRGAGEVRTRARRGAARRGSRVRDTWLAMSEEDVQRVREGLLASGSGDPLAGQRFWDASIEWDMSGVIGWAEKRVYTGPEVTKFLHAWADAWNGWHFDVEEVRDGDGEAVFAAIHESAIGAESGVSVDQRRYFVFTMREGRAVRIQMFSEPDDARAAAGLTA